MKAINYVLALALLLGTLEAVAAAGAKTYVVLLDGSASINADDRQVYRESFHNVRLAMLPGDRIVLATVGRRDRSEWIREIDAELPAPTGRRFADEKRRAQVQEEIGKTFEAVLARAERQPDRSTRILDAVEASVQAYPQSRAGKVLVVLSDMVETGRFDLASSPRKDVRAPDQLAGAQVYVAGAGGGRAYGQLEAFWKRYFESAAGVAVVQYGRYPVRLR